MASTIDNKTVTQTVTLGAVNNYPTYSSALTITSTGGVSTSGYGIVGPSGGTIINDGTVQGSEAIRLGAGGYVNNGVNTALITGSIYGVYIFGAAGTVINSGTIFGTSNGVNFRLGGNVSNTGYIHSTGYGMFFDAAATVTNSGKIAGSKGVVLQLGGTITDSGTISGSATAVAFGAGSNLLVLENGYKLTGTVAVAGSNNTLDVAGATGAVTANFNKAGAGFTNFGTVGFGAASGNDEIVQITNTTALPGTIAGFTQLHDIVDLTQFTNPGSAVFSFNAALKQLTVTEGAQSVTLQLDTSTAINWTASPDSGTGTDIIACFRRGTMILTPDGEVAVEALAIGDAVTNWAGLPRRVRWIGRRAYDGRFIAGKREVLPIRIAADALSDGVPARDLFVSPEHSLYITGVLAQAKHLVNGATIIQAETVEAVEYFHIELDDHDIIFADGAPTETFVDCDNRLMFANAAEYDGLYPKDERPRWEFCAERLEWGSEDLTAIRAWLLQRAEMLGHALDADPDLHLIADGETLLPYRAAGGLYRFDIPAGCHQLFLASRSSVPAEIEAESSDSRRLGVAVERLVLHDSNLFIEAAHTHPALLDGFHAAEERHRWTDGLARLPKALLRPFAGAFTLEVQLAAACLGYRLPPPDMAEAA